MSRLILPVLLFILFGCTVAAQDSPSTPAASGLRGVPVVFGNDTLLALYGMLGPYTPAARAEAVQSRLEQVLKNDGLSPDSIAVLETTGGYDIRLGPVVLMIVTPDDVPDTTMSVERAAQRYAGIIRTALVQRREETSAQAMLVNTGITVGIIVVSLFVLWLMTRIFPRLYLRVESWEAMTPSIRIRSFTVMSGARLNDFLILLLRGTRLVVSLLIIYYGVTTILGLFPATRSLNVAPVLRGILLAGLFTVLIVVLYRGMQKLFRFASVRLHQIKDTTLRPVTLKKVELLSRERIAEMSLFVLKIVRTFAVLVLGYIYITVLFSLFTFTETWATTLFSYVMTPVHAVVDSFIGFLPNLFVILVTIAVAYYMIRFARWIFEQIENGSLEFPHFYRDWAHPTFSIVRVLIIVFTVIVVFPYLPGSGSPAFDNVSLFLGLLLSISSASAVANAIAGIVLTYMRPFKVGDRVKIADTIGDVAEKTMLVTRVRTIKNVEITIPNAMVLSSHLINYSTSAQERGLILHTKITIGYDVPWRTVHELLIGAAQATPGILSDPKPFVLQTALNDFYVEYEINAYTDLPNSMATIYSALHGNIQDRFNEAGVEIMSPHYSAMRDGNLTTIPQDYLPASYEPTSFRLFGVNLFGGQKRRSGADNGQE